jgi:tetratricopeptide (TPR) repeat protein
MNTTFLFDRALALEQCNHFLEAFQLLQQCLQNNVHDRGDVLFHIGWCIENSNRRDDAIPYYQKAVDETAFPITKMNASFRAGWIRMHQKEYRKALGWYKKAIDCKELLPSETQIYPQAVYWYAVCAEALGQFLEALEWYRYSQLLFPSLDPESRYRQVVCLTQIGSYLEALQLCKSFESPAPHQFSEERYLELQQLAKRERTLIEAALMDDSWSECSNN